MVVANPLAEESTEGAELDQGMWPRGSCWQRGVAQEPGVATGSKGEPHTSAQYPVVGMRNAPVKRRMPKQA